MVAARARRDQAVATLRRAGLEPRPDVTVGVAAGRDEAAEENLMALRLSIPLPLFDRNKGKQQEARAGVREAEADIAATQQELLAAWRTAVARYKAAAEQVAAHRDRILPKSEAGLAPGANRLRRGQIRLHRSVGHPTHHRRGPPGLSEKTLRSELGAGRTGSAGGTGARFLTTYPA